MIIGKEYDLALSVILKCEKKNKEELIKFLEEFPAELYKKIQIVAKILEEKKEHQNLSEEEKEMMEGNCELNKMLYSYIFGGYDQQLSLCKYKSNGESYDWLYELSIAQISYDKNNPCIEMFDGESFGSIERSITTKDYYNNGRIVGGLEPCEEIEYGVMKLPIGWIVLTHIDDVNDKTKIRISKVNINKILAMQENLNVANLSQTFLPKRKIRVNKIISKL